MEPEWSERSEAMRKDVLKSFEMFSALDDSDISELEKISVKKRFNEDEIIFFEGETPNYFYLLTSGFVKIYKTDSKGNEIVLHNFAAPIMIAEMASLEDLPFPATAICKEPCEFILIKKDKFIEMLKTNSHISFNIIRSLTKKIKNVEKSLSRNLLHDSTTKVANFIYESPMEFKKTKNVVIAKELNISPETLSRTLRKFKDLNIIDQNHNLLDRDALKKYIQF